MGLSHYNHNLGVSSVVIVFTSAANRGATFHVEGVLPFIAMPMPKCAFLLPKQVHHRENHPNGFGKKQHLLG